MKKDKLPLEKTFKPIGATVFLILLLILAGFVWFSIYNIQVERF